MFLEDESPYFWAYNLDRAFNMPVLVLCYDQRYNMLYYCSSDSSLITYLLRDIGAFGYRNVKARDYVYEQSMQLLHKTQEVLDRNEPLRISDLEHDNYAFLESRLDSLDVYHQFFDDDNFSQTIADKIKANDCEEIYQTYRFLYNDKDEVERLYDTKGYAVLKKESENALKNHLDKRTSFYNRNEHLLSFLNISQTAFEALYDDLGGTLLQHRLDHTRDSQGSVKIGLGLSFGH